MIYVPCLISEFFITVLTYEDNAVMFYFGLWYFFIRFVSTACTYTDEFQVEENDMSDEKSKLIIFKEGEEIPLKTFPFDDDEVIRLGHLQYL